MSESSKAVGRTVGEMQATIEQQTAEIARLLARYPTTPGLADQYKSEARAARVALGYAKDADDVSPSAIMDAILDIGRERDQLKARNLQLAERLSYIVGLADAHENEHGNIVFWKEDAVYTLEQYAENTAAYDAEVIERAIENCAWHGDRVWMKIEDLREYANQLRQQARKNQ